MMENRSISLQNKSSYQQSYLIEMSQIQEPSSKQGELNISKIKCQLKYQDYTERSLQKIVKKRKNNHKYFEKNYPKNIFILILEYCNDLGLRQSYQKTIGTRQKFESKNVVSLTLIFQLLNQIWFKQSTNKRVLQSTICNKILLNSKIKKKLFHIKVAEAILNVQITNARQFKKIISKKANNIASNLNQNHELFRHSSTVIYLLNIFYQKLSNNSSIDFDTNDQISFSCNNTKMEQQIDYKIKTKGCKYEHKILVRKVIHIFNSSKNFANILDTFQSVKQAILKAQKQVQQLFLWNENVPSWGQFIHHVVEKCYTQCKNKRKITNLMMNQWINGFKMKITSCTLNNIDEQYFEKSASEFQNFQEQKGSINITQITKISQEKIITSFSKQKQFKPIILVGPKPCQL